MSTLKRRNVRSALTSKGFVEEAGSKHDKYKYQQGSILTSVSTAMSRGTDYRTLGPPLVGKIARDLRIDKEQLKDFVECPMSAEDYADHLRDEGVLPRKRQPFTLSEEEEEEVHSRLHKLMEDGCTDDRLYPLFGKLNAGTFDGEDLEILDRLEERYSTAT